MPTLTELTLPEPGHYQVEFDVYKSWDAPNASRLKLLKRSARHYLEYEETDREPTTAMELGSALHCAILEGMDEFGRRYKIEPGPAGILTKSGEVAKNPKVTAEWKRRHAEFMLTLGDCLPAPLEWVDLASRAHRSVMDNELTRKILLSKSKQIESSIIFRPHKGMLGKARLDLVDPELGVVFDLKTTSKAVEDIPKSIATYGYHISAAWYLEAAKQAYGREFNSFVLGFVEAVAPHSTIVAPLSEEALEVGRRELRRFMSELSAAKGTGYWPGPKSPSEFTLPSWYTS